MKKILVTIISIIAFSSCSKDDDNNNNSTPTGNIVGKWNIDRAGAIENGVEVDIEPFSGNISGCQKDYQEFSADGNYNLGDYTNNACNITIGIGSWTKEGNIIKISGGQFATYEIVSLTETTMKLKFKNPSQIDEYTDTFYLIKN